MIPIVATVAARIAGNVIDAWMQKPPSQAAAEAPAKNAAATSFDSMLQKQRATYSARDVNTLRAQLLNAPEVQTAAACFGANAKLEVTPNGDLSVTDQFGRAQTVSLSSQTRVLAQQLAGTEAAAMPPAAVAPQATSR